MKAGAVLKSVGLSLVAAMMSIQAHAATSAFATSNVNLRAGPSTSYPTVTVVPAGASVVNNGCLADYSWCDVSYANYRGWLAARYIQVPYQNQRQVLTPAIAFASGIAITAFSQSYWNNYYRGYPWYNTWGRYPLPPPPRPYLPPPGWRAPVGWGGPPPGWRAPPGYREPWGAPRPGYRPPPPHVNHPGYRPPPPPVRNPPHVNRPGYRPPPPGYHGGPPPGYRRPPGGFHGGPHMERR